MVDAARGPEVRWKRKTKSSTVAQSRRIPRTTSVSSRNSARSGILVRTRNRAGKKLATSSGSSRSRIPSTATDDSRTKVLVATHPHTTRRRLDHARLLVRRDAATPAIATSLAAIRRRPQQNSPRPRSSHPHASTKRKIGRPGQRSSLVDRERARSCRSIIGRSPSRSRRGSNTRHISHVPHNRRCASHSNGPRRRSPHTALRRYHRSSHASQDPGTLPRPRSMAVRRLPARTRHRNARDTSSGEDACSRNR